jgi:DnaK suppressor protein
MPAKKKISRKKAVSKTRNAVASKKTSKKKAGAKSRVSAKKKAAAKKTSKKKAAAKTKVSAKKKSPAKKKAAARKTSKKKAAAKTKVSAKKEAPAKKKVAAKKPARTATPKRARRTRAFADSDALIHGIDPYLVKNGEEYMNEVQLEHFKEILLAWKHELMEEVDRTVHHMQDEASNFPDPNDRATQESEFGLELRTRDRERKLLKKIDQAIERTEDGSYGYCEETGEEIGLKRLEARPVATLSVEAQERRELAEKQYRDRDDRYR